MLLTFIHDAISLVAILPIKVFHFIFVGYPLSVIPRDNFRTFFLLRKYLLFGLGPLWQTGKKMRDYPVNVIIQRNDLTVLRIKDSVTIRIPYSKSGCGTIIYLEIKNNVGLS